MKYFGRLIWFLGAATMGYLSYEGAMRWTGGAMVKSVLLAATFTGLGSALMGIARAQRNPGVALIFGCASLSAVTLCSLLDGLSVVDSLKQAYGIKAEVMGAEESNERGRLEAVKAQVARLEEETRMLAADVAKHDAKAQAEAEEMARQTDPTKVSDPRPGQQWKTARDAKIEAEGLKAAAQAQLDQAERALEAERERLAQAEASVRTSTTAAATAQADQFFLLRLADEQENGETLLLIWVSIAMGVPEILLVLLAWGLSGSSETQSVTASPAPVVVKVKAVVPGLHRRGKRFHLRVQRAGKRVSIPLETADEQEAIQRAHREIARLEAGLN